MTEACDPNGTSRIVESLGLTKGISSSAVAKAQNGETTIYAVAVSGLSQVLVETTGGESIVYLYGHQGSASLTTDVLADEAEAWQSETSAVELLGEIRR